jgi:hypothetical protein
LLHYLETGLTQEQLRSRLRAQGQSLPAAAQELWQLQQAGHVFTEGQGASRVYLTTPTWKPGKAGLPGKVTPEARRALVRRARAATEPVELWDTLRQLGLEDPTTPQAQAALERWGLKKHVNGWLNPRDAGGVYSTSGPEARLLSRVGSIHPALRSLPKEHVALWTDPPVLQQKLIDLYNLGIPGSAARDEQVKLVQEMDATVAAGMDALGLKPGEVNSVDVAMLGKYNGVKASTCDLRIGWEYLERALATFETPAMVWKTWVHERIHARRPFAPGAAAELDFFNGYEDGFAEMLARHITVEQARMTIRTGSYDYYVQAYEMLVRAAGVEPVDLWVELYRCHPGSIRSELPGILGQLRGTEYVGATADAIKQLGDELFAKAHGRRRATFGTAAINYLRWRRVLK